MYYDGMGTNTTVNKLMTDLSAAVGWGATWAEMESVRLETETLLTNGGTSNDVAAAVSATLGDRVSWATLEGLRQQLAAEVGA